MSMRLESKIRLQFFYYLLLTLHFLAALNLYNYDREVGVFYFLLILVPFVFTAIG